MIDDNQACKNTDREIWRGPDEGNGSYYADSIYVTVDGGIGINAGGRVIVMPLRAWHSLALRDQEAIGPCTQAEIDAWIETIDSKNSRLIVMWMERAKKAEAALAQQPGNKS